MPGLVVMTLMLGGCASSHRPHAVTPEVTVREVPVPIPVSVPLVSPVDAAGRQLLAWSEELQGLAPEALAPEIARLGDGSASASSGMRLAVLLGHVRGPGDLGRAQQVLEQLIRRGGPQTVSAAGQMLDWLPWARWLASRYEVERRMAEQLERQASLLRDSQRRQEQLHDKLEALKAIERQLAPRRGPAAVEGRPK